MAKMTPDIMESERKGFKNLQEKQGGIVPSKLGHGSVIIVETDEFMYEFTVDCISMPTVRYTVQTASRFCTQSGSQVIGIDATNRKLKLDIPDWIGKDMLMQLNYPTGTTVLTNAVTGVTILGKDKKGDEFQYDLW